MRALTDSSGSVVQSYRYDEYGSITSSEGSIDQPFRYTGEQYDPETGLVYLRARYYEPTSGRFLSRDGYAGHIASPQSLHRYSYVQDSPVTFSDPDGRCGPLCALLIAAGYTAEGAAAMETLVAVGATAAVTIHYYGDQIGEGVTQLGEAAGDLIVAAQKKLKPGIYVGDKPLAGPYDASKLQSSTGTPWTPPEQPKWGKDWKAKAAVAAVLVATIGDAIKEASDNVPSTPSKEPNNKT